MTDDQIKPETRARLEGLRELVKTKILSLESKLRIERGTLAAIEDVLRREEAAKKAMEGR